MTHWRARHSVLPNSGSQSGQPSIREFERGSSVLFLLVVLLPIALVGGVCIGYAAFVPQSIKYEQRVEADRFKGH